MDLGAGETLWVFKCGGHVQSCYKEIKRGSGVEVGSGGGEG